MCGIFVLMIDLHFSEANVKAPHPLEDTSIDLLHQFIKQECFESRGLPSQDPSSAAKVRFGLNKDSGPMSPFQSLRKSSLSLSNTPQKMDQNLPLSSLHATPPAVKSKESSSKTVARGLSIYDAAIHQVDSRNYGSFNVMLLQ